ncbi:MAG: hypothetical protein ACMG6S_33455 [Byssovorax sp.]
MVMRVPRDLPERLTTIAEHLYDETKLEYSFAAIVRGLIAIGLEKIDGAPSLAVEFAGARVARGRKAGSRHVEPTLDLTQGDRGDEIEPTQSNWERREADRKRANIERFDALCDAMDRAEARKAKPGEGQ